SGSRPRATTPPALATPGTTSAPSTRAATGAAAWTAPPRAARAPTAGLRRATAPRRPVRRSSTSAPASESDLARTAAVHHQGNAHREVDQLGRRRQKEGGGVFPPVVLRAVVRE